MEEEEERHRWNRAGVHIKSLPAIPSASSSPVALITTPAASVSSATTTTPASASSTSVASCQKLRCMSSAEG